VQYFEVIASFGFYYICGRQEIVRFDFLASENDMHCVTGACVRTVQEAVYSEYALVGKTRAPKGSLDGIEVASSNKDVDILRIANCGSVNARHPRGYGVATDNRVGDFGCG
jgi:hypothetical protein